MIYQQVRECSIAAYVLVVQLIDIDLPASSRCWTLQLSCVCLAQSWCVSSLYLLSLFAATICGPIVGCLECYHSSVCLGSIIFNGTSRTHRASSPLGAGFRGHLSRYIRVPWLHLPGGDPCLVGVLFQLLPPVSCAPSWSSSASSCCTLPCSASPPLILPPYAPL